jgi:hypothetical protein
MKKMILFLVAFMIQSMVINSQTNEKIFPVLRGPYIGQDPPGNQSRVFAPDFVSTDAGELNSVFTLDGREFYFSRRGVPGKPSTIMVSRMSDDVWMSPVPVDFSGIYSDIDLFIAPGGESMIFCSRRPHSYGEVEKYDHDFWISKREGDKWADPVLFAVEASSEYEDFYPVITTSGNLYFNSQRGGQRGNDIFCSKYVDGKYSMAEKLPEPVNSDSWEFDAYVTPDEKMIFFSSVRPGGYGGADIYLCVQEPDSRWSEPKNLGPEVNSSNSEYGSGFSPDGEYFFYTSNKNGSEDIYWVSADVIEGLPETVAAKQEGNTNEEIFINYFMKNWEDIHDVIMRYHNEDPGLKGLVEINMTWVQGILAYAVVLSNSTGDSAFGLSLVETMKKWTIPELADGWSSTLPIRTVIVGSDNPEFNKCGIFTGKITDIDGNPINGARLVIHKVESLDGKPDTVYTNREGIFIHTLIRPGTWQVKCTKQGYRPVEIDHLIIEEGQHCKRAITMIALDRQNQ